MVKMAIQKLQTAPTVSDCKMIAMSARMTKEEVEKLYDRLSSIHGRIKTLLGVTNNTTYYVLMNALDSAKELPCYKFQVKKAFVDVLNEYKAYERILKHHEMSLQVSNLYMSPFKKEMKDEDYFEWWQGLGGGGYQHLKPTLDKVHHALEVAFENAGAKNSKQLAYIILASKMFECTETLFDMLMHDAPSGVKKFPVDKFRELFDNFSMSKVKKAYEKAIHTLQGQVSFEKIKDEDIELVDKATNELAQMFCNHEWICKASLSQFEDYKEYVRRGNIVSCRKAIKTLWG